MEHSGTTWLADLIRGHPNINSGFECGVLLGASPADFPQIHPFYEWMLKAKNPSHWAVTPDKMARVIAAPDWDTMYARIMESSPLFDAQTPFLLDKTPAYMPILKDILKKVSAPIIVIYKPILYQYTSYKKRNISLADFVNRYAAYIGGFLEAYKHGPHRFKVILHEELVNNTQMVLQDIFRFLGVRLPEEGVLPDTIPTTPGPVYSDYNLEKARAAVNRINDEERTVLLKLSQDDLMSKLSRGH